MTLETGFAGGLRVDRYIAGGPGDAVTIARTALNWTFGDYRANVDLIDWLRRWNADRRHRRVRFVGADASGGSGEDGMGAAPLVVEDVVAYLEQALPAASAGIRATLAGFAPHFTNGGYAKLTVAQRTELDVALDAADSLLRDGRSEAIARTSPNAWGDARREVFDARRVSAMLALWPQGPGGRRHGSVAEAVERARPDDGRPCPLGA